MVALICDNCGEQIGDGDPIYQVREARVKAGNIRFRNYPASFICEKCFEKFMEATHEQKPKAYVKCQIQGGKREHQD